jgi:hypothetical protein
MNNLRDLASACIQRNSPNRNVVPKLFGLDESELSLDQMKSLAKWRDMLTDEKIPHEHYDTYTDEELNNGWKKKKLGEQEDLKHISRIEEEEELIKNYIWLRKHKFFNDQIVTIGRWIEIMKSIFNTYSQKKISTIFKSDKEEFLSAKDDINFKDIFTNGQIINNNINIDELINEVNKIVNLDSDNDSNNTSDDYRNINIPGGIVDKINISITADRKGVYNIPSKLYKHPQLEDIITNAALNDPTILHTLSEDIVTQDLSHKIIDNYPLGIAHFSIHGNNELYIRSLRLDIKAINKIPIQNCTTEMYEIVLEKDPVYIRCIPRNKLTKHLCDVALNTIDMLNDSDKKKLENETNTFDSTLEEFIKDIKKYRTYVD